MIGRWILWATTALCLGATACSDDPPASSASTGAGGSGASGAGAGPASASVSSSSAEASSSSVSTGSGGDGGAGGSGAGGSGVGGSAPAYPPGPYGTTKGSVIANYALEGFVDASVSTTLVPIQLGDFYNPTGMATYPAGSQYGAGTPMPRALYIDACAVWAGPCNAQADTFLPPRYAMYAPQSGEFLEILIDGPTPGTAATVANLVTWTDKYAVNYPAAIDPQQTYLDGTLQAYPTALIVDPRTMIIVEVYLGIPDDTFWTKYEGVLNAP